MRLFLFTSLLFIISIIYTQCANQSAKNKKDLIDPNTFSQMQKMDFEDIVDTIEARVTDLTHSGILFEVKEFLYLYNNPEKFESNALKLISDSSKSGQEKMVAVYSLQKLSDNKYIGFVSKMANLYKDSTITEEIMILSLASPISPKTAIIQNYKDKKVIELLQHD